MKLLTLIRRLLGLKRQGFRKGDPRTKQISQLGTQASQATFQRRRGKP